MFIKRVKAKILRIVKSEIFSRVTAEQFRGDPNYKLARVNKGLEPRKFVAENEAEILSRIIAAYNKAKEGQRHSEACFSPSNEWLPIYEKPLVEVMTALKEGNVRKLGLIYQNFMRDACSYGLVGLPVDMQKLFFSAPPSRSKKRLYLNDFLWRIRLWKCLLGKTCSLGELESPNIGNPYGLDIDGKFIKTGADYLHYYATVIQDLLDSNSENVVVELGAGYGGMAYFLCKKSLVSTYIDFDLPENIALASYYLLSAFPDKKFALYGEAELNEQTLKSYDFWLLPSFEIKKVPPDCADVAFNSYSLAEMSADAIRAYVSAFSKISKKHILHVNHTRDSLVKGDDFGFDEKLFKLRYRTQALWNAGRTPNPDEFEYLYDRI